MQGHNYFFCFVIDYIYNNIPLSIQSCSIFKLYTYRSSLHATWVWHTDEMFGGVGDKCSQYFQCPPTLLPNPLISVLKLKSCIKYFYRHIMHMHCMLYPQQTSLKYVYAHTLSSFFKELCMPLDHPCEGGYR